MRCERDESALRPVAPTARRALARARMASTSVPSRRLISTAPRVQTPRRGSATTWSGGADRSARRSTRRSLYSSTAVRERRASSPIASRASRWAVRWATACDARRRGEERGWRERGGSGRVGAQLCGVSHAPWPRVRGRPRSRSWCGTCPRRSVRRRAPRRSLRGARPPGWARWWRTRPRWWRTRRRRRRRRKFARGNRRRGARGSPPRRASARTSRPWTRRAGEA